MPYQIVGRLYIGRISHISGKRHGQLPLREREERSQHEGGKQQEPSLLPYSVHVLVSGQLVGQQQAKSYHAQGAILEGGIWPS